MQVMEAGDVIGNDNIVGVCASVCWVHMLSFVSEGGMLGNGDWSVGWSVCL